MRWYEIGFLISTILFAVGALVVWYLEEDVGIVLLNAVLAIISLVFLLESAV